MLDLGDREVGSIVEFQFPTFYPAGNLNDQFQNTANTGNPTFTVKRISDNTTSSTGLTTNVNQIFGIHDVLIDTSQSATFFKINETYDYISTDGEIHDGSTWINVTNVPIARFNLQATSAGKILDRAVKVPHGAVILAAPRTNKEFVLQIDNAGTAINYYQWQIIQWQPGAVNQGIGRVVLRSTTAGSQVTMTLANSLPQIPNVGDVAALIPEEQPRRIAVANITAEYTPTDKYWAEWSTDGELKLPDAAPILNVWNAVTDVHVLQNKTMVQKAENVWFYDSLAASILPHQAARIKVSATIDQIAYVWTRIYPHTVQ